MPTFRKVAALVDAVQWTGDNEAELAQLAGPTFACMEGNALLYIGKSRAWSPLSVGTWIMAEPDGSGFYPCTAPDFATTYEAVAVSRDGVVTRIDAEAL